MPIRCTTTARHPERREGPRYLLFLSLVTLLTLPAHSQVTGQNTKPASDQTYTMSVTSKLVIEAINVKDKQGKSIPGLTAKDFVVTEDGIAQKVSFLEYQELPTAPHPPAIKGQPK